MTGTALHRRNFLRTAAAVSALAATPFRRAFAQSPVFGTIPKTGERIPAVGMGTWVTFNVGNDAKLRDNCAEVTRTFLELGGGMIDSSPMYGSAEDVIGSSLEKIGNMDGLFSATKVWTPVSWHGERQVDTSFELWGVPKFDLFQVHNLLNVDDHLAMLREQKQAGRIRYIGITTSHGMRHEDMAKVMQRADIDFVQLTYNAVDRDAESRLLPLAADLGIAVIANRPYRRSNLIDAVQRYPLPEWAADAGAANWPEFLLKFIISHPAITCTIPATSQVQHMRENKAAMHGPLPDPAMRKRMAAYVEAL